MTRFLAVLSGLLLTTAVGLLEPWTALPVLALVTAGWRWRVLAVAAVLAALGVVAWLDTGAVEAGAIGLVATTYLLNTATVSAPVGVVPTTIPSVAGAIVFTLAAGAAALLPIHLAWAPIAAPIVVILLYAWLIQGLGDRRPADG
ncbi:hypothetical protein FOH10_28840 [Nocardia otitidiscaviarum]|uniref:Uncharacterized protein n=1 Tax=Nocardia otitidiscaviarum TaxID=1823 RepID=A0A516NTA7_9NOCA|nr:hypothetical protein [Nocardia otitidiscaviarum]MCP9621459.1 hypothetical protein [Nocardia otitidiscaviarum]QDP82139.1 hypothetical protein FOH10_28840 [Nocardia otitidiscaviarum]